jgi:hypothetical protein
MLLAADARRSSHFLRNVAHRFWRRRSYIGTEAFAGLIQDIPQACGWRRVVRSKLA